MKRLSIGIFTYSSKPRGSVVHAAQLAEALTQLGHEATLYALDKDGEGFFRELGCRLVRIQAAPAPVGGDALISQRIGELASYLGSARPAHDVLHAEDCLMASGLLAARTQLPTGLLCRTVHHVERFESSYLEACQERSVREVDLCFSVSRATRHDVLSSYGRSTPVVPNGVDALRFASAPRAAACALRAQLGIAATAPLVVSVGGVEPRKNSLIMLEAFVSARRKLPDLCWLVAGGASIFEHAAYRAEFERRLSALPAETRLAIARVGVLPDAQMPALFAAADLLLHASRQEGFGLCVLEAMAARTRVVVSRGAPFDEYLDDSCALCVDPDDPAQIAAAIVASLEPDPARSAAAALRASAYSWQRCAQLHDEHYTRALRARRELDAASAPASTLRGSVADA